ncbi:ATP-grasp domain-containing protein [Streptomyces sp. NPDC003710]
MSVLVLHQVGSVHAVPYDQWFADYDGDVLLLVSRDNLERVGEELPPAGAGYAHAEAVDGYDTGGELEERALDLARQHGVRHVVASHERDLERAAVLREILALPGQQPDSVLPFRDKSLMKKLAAAAGVQVAAHREIETATDIVSFAAEHGYPVVLKPRDSAGSVGLRILHTREELEGYLEHDFDLYGAGQPNIIAEEYVPGPLCHVDGLVLGGKVALAWPSQYQYALATYATDTGPRIDLTLDTDDPLAHRLLAFTERLLQALPGPENFAFHAEVFHTPDDELVLCEIACRTGGAAIRDVITLLFGADPTRSWLRAELGLPVSVPRTSGAERPLPRTMTGQMVLMKRPGRVVAVPETPPDFPWIERFRVFVKPGRRMTAARTSSDFLCTVLVSGRDRAEVEERLRRVEAWFLGELVLEDVAHGGAPSPGPTAAVAQ